MRLTVHSWLAMCCTCAGIASARARASVVFPVPLAPVKIQLDEYGRAASLAMIFRGFSRPTKSASWRGRYLSVRSTGCGAGCDGNMSGRADIGESPVLLVCRVSQVFGTCQY